MLDIKLIREDTKIVKQALKDRGMKFNLDELLQLDKERRKLLTEVEALKRDKNKASEEIGKLLRDKKEAKSRIAKVKATSQKIDKIDAKVGEIDKKLGILLLNIPNLPHKEIPKGGPDKNKVVHKWGEIPHFSFSPRDHIELTELLDIMNFNVSAKIAGSGFAFYKGVGARLERALLNFMLDLHTKKHGYTEVFPPFLVNRASMTGTGQLPKFEEDMYRLKDDDLFLIPTAEVPVTNIHRNDILKEEDLPIFYTAYTACFRREAGSYGKDTKGLTRVHQFDKVELVKFVKPETSWDEMESLLKDAEEVLQLLEIPYREVMLATGDISFAASKCYDIEIWAPGLNRWLEVSSCSNFTDFQARRTNIKYRPKGSKKTEYLHTLNGSGVALARLFVSLLEIHQQKDGSCKIPESLRPYIDGMEYIKPAT